MTQTTLNSEAFLRKFHAQYAGATATLRAARASDGRTSYERRTQLVPGGREPIMVLDLACGDGPLLELLLQRHQPRLRLVGVNMSPEELALARRRLGADRVDLRLERAQQLSRANASVDCVLCHLALMLMDPIEGVASEIRRVLKPRGQLAAVVNGEFIQGDAMEAFVLAATDLILQEGMGGSVALGDRRTCSVAGLRSLFNARTGFDEPPTIEDFLLHLDGPLE